MNLWEQVLADYLSSIFILLTIGGPGFLVYKNMTKKQIIKQGIKQKTDGNNNINILVNSTGGNTSVTVPNGKSSENLKNVNSAEKDSESFTEEVNQKLAKIDDIGLLLMINYGRKPKGENHFSLLNLGSNNIAIRFSVQKLIDLGIIKLIVERRKNKDDSERFDYAYHWTDLGYEIMKKLEII